MYPEMSTIDQEIESQPDCWRRAATSAGELEAVLGDDPVAIIGCGSSYFVALAAAALRGARAWTDAFVASEVPSGREYGAVVAISRSGTTTEVIDALARAPRGARRVVLTAAPDQPLAALADVVVALPFADEQSVVQTRFVSTAMALFRTVTGDDVERAAAAAEAMLAAAPWEEPADIRQEVFLGTGWAVGVAFEAALKLREAAQVWSEAYPAGEYRHGPIAVADESTQVWLFGEPPAGLAEAIGGTGAQLVPSATDPLAQLVRAQRYAVALARSRALDPERPRYLSRSVILRDA